MCENLFGYFSVFTQLLGWSAVVLGLLWCCPGICWGYSGVLLNLFWGCSGVVLALFWGCSWLVLGLFSGCSGLALGLFWGSSGLVLVKFWGSSGVALSLFSPCSTLCLGLLCGIPWDSWALLGSQLDFWTSSPQPPASSSSSSSSTVLELWASSDLLRPPWTQLDTSWNHLETPQKHRKQPDLTGKCLKQEVFPGLIQSSKATVLELWASPDS